MRMILGIPLASAVMLGVAVATAWAEDAPVAVAKSVTIHVSPEGTGVAPHATWETAAPTIQAGVDAAKPGDTVLVGDGTYDKGGRKWGNITNRVVVDKKITVRSLNGPKRTIVYGGGERGPAGVRGVVLLKPATFSGFTVRDGIACSWQKDWWQGHRSGGGIWCASTNAVVSNCVIEKCWAYSTAGGVYQGTLIDCTIRDNEADDWGSGGAYKSVLKNCTLSKNRGKHGAAAIESVLIDCTVSENATQNDTGPLVSCTVSNCAITGNVMRDL